MLGCFHDNMASESTAVGQFQELLTLLMTVFQAASQRSHADFYSGGRRCTCGENCINGASSSYSCTNLVRSAIEDQA